MAMLHDLDRPMPKDESDLNRKPRVCDWDKIERARRISPTELGADVWFVLS